MKASKLCQCLISCREQGVVTGGGVSYPELGEGVWVVCQAQGVEGLTGVQSVQTLTSGAAVHTVTLDQAHEHNLHTRIEYF